MYKEKEEKIIKEITQKLDEKYDEEDEEKECDEQEMEERRRQGRARAWKDSKQMLMIVIPLLIVTYIGMKIFFNYLIEKHQKEKAAEALKIEQELKTE